MILKCWWLLCGGVVQVVASPKKSAVCEMHPQGQRCQTTSRDQEQPTIKPEHRCFSLISASFSLISNTAGLHKIFDNSLGKIAKCSRLLSQWHGRNRVKTDLEKVISSSDIPLLIVHLHQGIVFSDGDVPDNLKVKSQKAHRFTQTSLSHLVWEKTEVCFTF